MRAIVLDEWTANDHDPVIAGLGGAYQLTVHNGGPSNATLGFTVTDTLPAGFTFTATGSSTACVAGAGNTVVCTATADLAPGADAVYVIALTAAASIADGAVLTNSATVAVVAGDTDDDATNNTDTETTTVQRHADLGITKSDLPDPVVAGTNLVYTITVTNNGPSNSTGFVVSDTLPTGTSWVSFGGASAADCAEASGVVTCTHSGDLAPGASVTYTVTVLVDDDLAASATLSNTATVDGTDVDLVTTNDSATEPTDVDRVADLQITKSDSVDPVIAGTNLTYTITVKNWGPSASTGFVVSDTLPTGTSFVSFGGANAADCAEALGVVTCTRTTDLAVGASVSYQVTVLVASTLAATASLSNTAGVTGTDSQGADTYANSATETTAVDRQADLGITKADSADPVIAGTNLSYTITVHNYGPSSSTGLSVSDTLPAGLTFTATGSSGACAAVGQVVTCSRATDLAVGAEATFTVVVAIAASVADDTTLSNTASVTGTDPEPAGASHANSATETTHVDRNADLGITKTDSPDPVMAGYPLTYTVSVTNYGPSYSTGFTVTDSMDLSKLTFVSVTGSSSADCSYAAGTITCTHTSDLAVGATITYTINVTVNYPLAATSLTTVGDGIMNTASVLGHDSQGADTRANSATSETDVALLSFVSTSWITQLATQILDNLVPYTVTDFEILMNNKNVIVATNPSQFFYHQRAVNPFPGLTSWTFTLNWPSAFSTQTTNGQPIKAYVQLATDAPDVWRIWNSQSTGICWSPTSTAACSGNDATITLHNVPQGAKVSVLAHLDYNLKGTTQSSTFAARPITYGPFSSSIEVKDEGTQITVGASYSETSILGRGKKVTVVYGIARDFTGAAMANVWIRLQQGTRTAIAKTDGDGNYLFYDGQACTLADGLAGGCSGGWTTTLIFGSGNVASTVAILGNGPTPSASPQYPNTLDPFISVDVRLLSTTLVSYSSPTAPSYVITIGKGSAYNRDWWFGF